ncbi:MAG: hypothetical protein OXT69_05375 [Candidatus Poribacteria bacterium]|nr:hypothetical protein [Candidatus Poribacteria bacterium]
MLRIVRWMSAVWIFCAGCGSQTALFQPAPRLVNLARLPGTTVDVSSWEEGFDPTVLTDGVVSAEEWSPAVGWESTFDGALERRRLFNVEVDAAAAGEPFEWKGLRRNYRLGKEYAAFGWVLIRFDKPRKAARVVLHSVNTERYPATRFGIRDVLVQYWDDAQRLWVNAGEARGNQLPRLAVSFDPVETQYLRAAALWVNGSQKQDAFRAYGRYEFYVTGTIRLHEVEAYGIAED